MIRRKTEMKKRKDFGRGSGRLCRVLLAGFFVLFLALLPLAAWPMQRAEIKEEPIEIETPTAMTEKPIAEESLQNKPSGTASESISTEQSSLLTKAEEGRRLNGDESQELYFTLVEARDEAAAAREASEAKDAEITDLKARLASAEEETGTKAYLMVDGIIGFSEGIPDYGLGLTIGTRIGNSLMAELGVDYTVGMFDHGMIIKEFSLDNFEFRASVGWMF